MGARALDLKGSRTVSASQAMANNIRDPHFFYWASWQAIPMLYSMVLWWRWDPVCNTLSVTVNGILLGQYGKVGSRHSWAAYTATGSLSSLLREDQHIALLSASVCSSLRGTYTRNKQKIVVKNKPAKYKNHLNEWTLSFCEAHVTFGEKYVSSCMHLYMCMCIHMCLGMYASFPMEAKGNVWYLPECSPLYILKDPLLNLELANCLF